LTNKIIGKNPMSSLIAPVEWQQQAAKFLIQGNYTQAINIYEQAIEVEPNIKSHYWYFGLILLLQGQDVEAQTTWFMAMLEGEPEELEMWNGELVKVLQTEAERREYLEEYPISWKIRQEIKEINPQEINNLLNIVNLAIKLDTYTGDELTQLGVIEILKLEPLPEVNFELLREILQSLLDGAALLETTLNLVEASLPYFQGKLLELLKIILPCSLEIGYSQRFPKIAAKYCELYLQLDEKNTEVLFHLASFYQNCNDFEKGIKTAKLAYSLTTNLADIIFANRQILRGLMTPGGYWEEAENAYKHQLSLISSLIEQKPTNLEQVRNIRLYNANYFATYFEDNPRQFRKIQNELLQVTQANCENYTQQHVDKFRQGIAQRKQHQSSTKKLKIGYLSHCLKRHSVGWLAKSLFQHHDKEKFEINGYFLNTNPICDPLHEWYLSQVDKAYKSSDVVETAQQIYEDEVDILIELDSITLDTTCEIMALKPAPIQGTWLGWDASGVPNIDYFIADPYVLPESAEEYYSEKIWRLPQTYIAVDGFDIGVPTVRRSDLDIPSDAIVYLCTQRGFKRHPETTRMQLRIVKEVPNSYFLIKGPADEELTKDFFYKLAEEEGVDTSKMRFLPDVAFESIHRANLGIADIVLDTFPYNGATTTMETLWMCLPLVTRVGEQFAARNSYTMMINAGITEGIAWSDEEYIEWGIRLGKDEALRQKIAWDLKASRQTAPLWNAKQFTSEMEKAYEQMWQRYIAVR
jgi:predicted O-linked N-acetylglucosamine transferase (SPINDLY family)